MPFIQISKVEEAEVSLWAKTEHKAGFGNKRSDPDLVTSRPASLHFYQLAIPAPTPLTGSGASLFTGKAVCATCDLYLSNRGGKPIRQIKFALMIFS